MSIVVLANCLFMAAAANHQLEHLGEAHPRYFYYADVAFTAAYIFEFVVRFARLRFHYFFGVGYLTNWVDFFLVLMGIVWAFGDAVIPPSTGSLRTLRILRLSKALRVLKWITLFKSLRDIVNSLTNTAGAVASSLFILLISTFMFALFIVISISWYLEEDGDPNSAEGQKLLDVHGSIGKTMLCLAASGFGGESWIQNLDILAPTGWVNCALLLAYILFIQIALLNVVLGLFVDHVMKALRSDTHALLEENRKEELEVMDGIGKMLEEADADGTGRLTLEEWKMAIESGELLRFLNMHGFRPMDVNAYFDVSSRSSPDGKVNVKNFVKGCFGMKGAASAFDILEVLYALKELKAGVKQLQHKN